MTQGIDYHIGIQSSQATAALGGLRAALGGLRAAGSMLAGVLAPLGAALSIGGFAAGIRGAFDLGGRLSDLSARTGESAGSLAVLEQAFRNAGMSSERVGPAINLMQRALSGINDLGQPTARAFERLGLSAESLRGQSATAQLQAISQAMQGVTDPAERSAIAMQLFGRSGGEMLALLADPAALSDAAATVGSQAEILARNATLFDRVSDLLSTTGTKVQGFFVGVADKVAPVLLPILEAFQKSDLAALGQQIGDIIAFLAAAFSSGQISDIIGSSIILAFQHAVNFLWSAIQGISAALGQSFLEAGRILTEILSICTRPDFWAGIGKSLQAAAISFTARLLDAINALQGGFIALLRKFGADKLADSLQAGLDRRRATADSLRDQASDLNTQAADTLAPYLERYQQQLADSLANIASAYQEAASAAGPIFDPAARQQVLDSALDAVFAEIERARAAAENIQPATAAAVTVSPDQSGPAALAARTAAATLQADRLAQIGGFVGAASSDRAIRPIEQTAANTARIAKATERLASATSQTIATAATF